MQQRTLGLCMVLLLATSNLTSAQVFRLPNPFRRSRLAAPRSPAAATAPAPTPPPPSPSTAAVPSPAHAPIPAAPAPSQAPTSSSRSRSSSSISSSNSAASRKCSGNWALSAIAANPGSTSLPVSTDRVLICLISSGVHKDALNIKQNRWTGCTKEDPLDPTGCALPWDTSPTAAGFRPRGSWVAAIMAASGSGVIPGATDIHVVPVDTPGTGAVDPNSAAPSGKSRLRAYSVCEGRLRGLQAMDYGSSSTKKPWRMVMMVDVAADKQATTGFTDYSLSEAEWVKVATGVGTPEAQHPPDVLIVAPTGHTSTVGFPAALPGVLGVGGFKCSGEPLQNYTSSGKPDILAPGINVAIPDTDKSWSDSAAAAALVAGAAARLWSAYPRCNADEIRAGLLASVSSSRQPAHLNVAAATLTLEMSPCGSEPVTR